MNCPTCNSALILMTAEWEPLEDVAREEFMSEAERQQIEDWEYELRDPGQQVTARYCLTCDRLTHVEVIDA